MTQDQIMALVDAYAVTAYTTHNPDSELADHARAAVVTALEALTKDAARYQWLRDGCGEHHIGVYDYASDDKRRFWLAEKNLDREIDAAMKESK